MRRKGLFEAYIGGVKSLALLATFSGNVGQFLMIGPILTLESERFPISPDLFAQASARYGCLLADHPEPPSIDVTQGTNRDSVLQFLAACHSRPTELTRENLNDCFVLASQWQVSDFINQITKFATAPENIESSLISLLSHAFKAGCDISCLIDLCVENFLQLQTELLTLPLPLLSRITASAETFISTHIMFSFLVASLLRFGAEASVLFTSFDYTKLESGQFAEFLESQMFPLVFPNRSVGELMLAGLKATQKLPRRTASAGVVASTPHGGPPRAVPPLCGPPRAAPPQCGPPRAGPPRSPMRRATSRGDTVPASPLAGEDPLARALQTLDHVERLLADNHVRQDMAAREILRKVATVERDVAVTMTSTSEQLQKMSDDLNGILRRQSEQVKLKQLEIEMAQLNQAVEQVSEELTLMRELNGVKGDTAEHQLEDLAEESGASSPIDDTS